METQLIFQTLVNTMALTGIYALLAIGLSFIYGMLRIIQFAHGQLYMLGAYIVWLLVEGAGMNFFAALLIATIGVGLFSLMLERVFLRPLMGRPLMSVLIGIGILMGLEGGVNAIFGGREKYIVKPWVGVVSLFGASIPESRLVIFGVAAGLIAFLFLLLRKTKIGKTMRAVAEDPEAAALQGINVNRIRPMGFALASAMGGLAGGLMLASTYATPFMGSGMVITAFLIMILGGMGSLPGAVVGSFVLASIDTIGFTFWGLRAVLISYVLVIVILIIRPQGLFGHHAGA